MSFKSKKTTADKTSRGEKEVKVVSKSVAKMINRLSLSFYAEDTLKKNKQVILDQCEELLPIVQGVDLVRESTSVTKTKSNKPKTPVMRLSCPSKEPVIRRSLRIGQNSKQTSNKERSSSRSSRGKKNNNQLLDYLNNRIGISGKCWNTLKPMLRTKAQNPKHGPTTGKNSVLTKKK